ncbi:hypothetical protein VTL71DRAFT_4147 [Oculimacula yallundae]|uniref:RING-type E3 ubiquitin transferase n=1 Tax=Oculimacula yallundae TaxID=86028 RepID=A0ABR4C5R7_9HELO
MDPQAVSGSISNSSSALDERPLPPLPTSDVDDQPRAEGQDRADYDGEEPDSKIQGNDQVPGGIASQITGSTHGTEHSPVRPARSPFTEADPEYNPQLASSETQNIVADAQRGMSVTVAAPEGSSLAGNIEARPSSQMPTYSQSSPNARDGSVASRPVRSILRSGNSSESDSAGDSGLRGQIAIRTRNREENLDSGTSTEQAPFSVPKWQSDATVTLCPICRTQFSFFVRKHHCRKCGRVVCGSCSPHRITIPHQYIVQPPAVEQTSPSQRTRPRLDSGRTGSSNVVDNLSGGERVRLCNPCVPDPNIAPPQVLESRNNQARTTQLGHSRSVSSTVSSAQSRSSVYSPSTTSSTYAHRRPRDAGSMASYLPSTSYTERNSRMRPVDLQNRSRSSTVGTNQISASVGNSTSAQSQWTGTPGRSEQLHSSSSRPSAAPRLVIREEDECWICHKELPSRALTDWENKRAEHVNNCLSLAMQGPQTSVSPSPSPAPASIPAPITIPSQPPRTRSISQAESSRATQVTPTPAPPIANTPEARMAARERAHAAVVLASSSGTSPIRRTGVFPYKATEKDCIDDAECTICLEEFEVGEDMGRLECFCRFHLKCIREWFVNRPGQCPVHQHGAGY